MMRYTVTWRKDQKQKLARIWLASTDRRSVSAAADRIDRLLAENPQFVGDDFYGDFIVSVPPLVVVYTISREDRIAQVVSVYHEGAIGE
jgi:plasmid stabilization system protein ParE